MRWFSFWYHPQVARTTGSGPRVWGSDIWGEMWARDKKVIGDIWNSIEAELIIPGGLTAI
jgi:hypothetical protein